MFCNKTKTPRRYFFSGGIRVLLFNKERKKKNEIQGLKFRERRICYSHLEKTISTK